MDKNTFELELANLILDTVKEPESYGRVRRLSSIGHFNRSIFQPEAFLSIDFKLFVRVAVNLSMELTQEDFMDLWLDMGNRIYCVGEESGDVFNENHRRVRQ